MIGVLTGRDLVNDIKTFAPVIELAGYREVRRPVVAVDRVNFVGEYVAIVLAETPYTAHDAIELVEVDYAPLPSVAGIDEAMRPEASVVHEHLGDNFIFRAAFETDDFAARFAEGDVVLEEEFRTGRVTGVMIEPRGCIMAGEAEEPHWAKARREKRAAHKAARRDGAAEASAE